MKAIFLALISLSFFSTAHACRFAKDARPAEWFEWAAALFAADVASIQGDAKKDLDLIDVRVVETFKGPPAASAKLEVPSRMWRSCLLERPSAGARVLVALNANGDTLLVPLSAAYADLLRAHRGAKPRSPTSTPAWRSSGAYTRAWQFATIRKTHHFSERD